MARPLDDDVRRRIVLATFSLVAAHGVQGMTMRQVAEATGLSTGTVTYHFGTKRALLFAAVDYYYEARPDRSRPAADADALATLRTVVRRYDLRDARVETWWRFWLAVNAHAQRGDADLHERLAQHHHGALDVFRRLVVSAVAEGTLHVPDPRGVGSGAATAEQEGERLGLLAHGLAITQLVDPVARATAASRLAAEVDRLAAPDPDALDAGPVRRAAAGA